ncbi:MAG: GDSL-type esterase/lipase family protein [Kofleriaceae bacterium]
MTGLCVFDGGVGALADRLTVKRAEPPPAPAMASAPQLAMAKDADDVTVPPRAAPAISSDGARGGWIEDVCVDGAVPSCKQWAMDPFYAAVASETAGKLGRAVRVSWYGDSVIATDAIPARLRSQLQTELGDGGPGFIYASAPHRFCDHEVVTRTTHGDWRTYAISTTPVSDHIYGAGGSTAETIAGTADLKLTSGKATQVALYYLGQPRGGTAIVSADGAEVLRADTKADPKQSRRAAATVASGASRFKLETKGRVRLFGIGLENSSGITVDNFGIVSVNVKSFLNHDTAHLQTELVDRGADLIMMMIGANEAHWLGDSDRSAAQYQTNFEKVLTPIRSARPDAACLVISPTDQAEAGEHGFVSRAVMPKLVNAQRAAARAAGCAFFSLYDWMGGKGSAVKWYKKGLIGSDFTHPSRKGANKMADALFDALIAGYRDHAPR